MSDVTLVNELTRLKQSLLSAVTRIDELLQTGEVDAVESATSRLPIIVTGRCEYATQHAVDRFRERTQSKKSDATLLQRMRERIERADEFQLKPRYRIAEALAHNAHARYFRSNDLMFVIEGGGVVTVHHGKADRWIPLNNSVPYFSRGEAR